MSGRSSDGITERSKNDELLVVVMMDLVMIIFIKVVKMMMM